LNTNLVINAVIDSSTGEVYKETQSEYYSPYQEGKGYNFRYKSLSVKYYQDIDFYMFKDSELGKLFKLSKFIYKETNLLAIRTNGKVRPLSTQEIQEIVGLSKSRCSEFICKLKNCNILRKRNINGSFYLVFNPLMFNSCKYVPKYLYLIFKDILDQIIPEWVQVKYMEEQ
jgi:predicted transcriptional regulator